MNLETIRYIAVIQEGPGRAAYRASVYKNSFIALVRQDDFNAKIVNRSNYPGFDE